MSDYNTNNTYYVSVTIGRNIGDQPMNDQDWADFKIAVIDAIITSGKVNGTLFEGEGAGVWDGDSEQAFTYAAVVSFNPEDVQGDISTLNARLAYLATLFNQDAIARVLVPLPNGDETLVYADK